MPRPYSFDHFQAKKPVQTYVGATTKAGMTHEQLTPVKSELAKDRPDTLPGAKGGLHYGRDHSETVTRLQARRKTRAAAAAERKPAAKKKQATAATRRGTSAAKAATRRDTAVTKAATQEGTRVKRPKAAESESTKAPTARKTTTTTKQGLLSRVIGKVAKGTKEVARQAAAARTARANKKATTPKGKPGKKKS